MGVYKRFVYMICKWRNLRAKYIYKIPHLFVGTAAGMTPVWILMASGGQVTAEYSGKRRILDVVFKPVMVYRVVDRRDFWEFLFWGLNTWDND